MNDRMEAHINLFGAWDERFTAQDVYSGKPETDKVKDLIELVLQGKVETLTLEIIQRFAELSPSSLYLPIVPNEQKLVDRLLRPLKSAKCLYCLEEYLATIALAGLVGESLAMFVFRIRKIEFGGNRISREQQKLLFGNEFDKLGQERRINVLRSFNLITVGQTKLFFELKGLRNKYIHFWEVDSSKIQQDAKECFLNAMSLFKQISGLVPGDNGIILMHPDLLNYINVCKLI